MANENSKAVDLPMVEIRGVKDGVETSLGMHPMPPTMRARDILRAYGFSDIDDDMSQDALALAACEDVIDYCKAYYEQEARRAVPAGFKEGEQDA